MRVLVCGSRASTDRAGVFTTLSDAHREHPFTLVITGGAAGVDCLADQWAASMGIDRIVFPANWAAFGKSAGPLRNKRMITEGKPDLVIAFPGGQGTANMRETARKASVPVVTIATEPHQVV